MGILQKWNILPFFYGKNLFISLRNRCATDAWWLRHRCATVEPPLRHCCATEIDRLLYSSFFFFFFLFGNVRFGPPGVPASGSRYCHVVFAEDEAVEKALEMRLTPRRMVVQENDKHGVKSTLLENPLPFLRS